MNPGLKNKLETVRSQEKERNQIPYLYKNCSIPCTVDSTVDSPLIMVILSPIPMILQIYTFNNYFASIAQATKKSIKYSHQHFSNETSSTILLQPTDKEEIANIMSSLNFTKASGQNSIYIPYRILFLLKNEILKQLADLFNLSFMTGVFPSVLETAKVVPVFKKDSKLDYSNYRPISL